MIKLQIVENPDHVAQAKALFQEYAETRKNDPALEDFHEEIDNLPGKYAAPDGNLILAYSDGKLAGCVAVHKLADGVCETVHLVVQDHDEVIYIDKVEPFQTSSGLQMVSRLGTRIPMHCCSVGKVILANLSSNEIEAILKRKGLPRSVSLPW